MKKRRLPSATSGIRRERGPKRDGSSRMRRRLPGFLAVLLLMAPAPVGATTVAYWRFEEGTADTQASGANSVLDETANDNDGTPVGNPFYRSDPPVSPVPRTGAANSLSLQLDGSGDYVGITHSTSLNLTDGFTVEFWMKGNPTQGESLYLVVDKSHGWTDSTGWGFQGATSTGKLGFIIGTGGSGSTNYAAATSTVSLLDNKWHHVAGTFDSTDTGQEIKLYIDGAIDATGASGSMVTNSRAINIGASWHGGSAFNRFFNGFVDEVRISDTILQPSQFLVPEPSALTLLSLALAGLGFSRRWRHPRAR